MLKKRSWAAAAAMTFVLAACGGGGGDDDTGPGKAEGVWNGTTQDGADVSLIVLDDGQVWGGVSAGGMLYAMLQAPSSSINGSDFSASGMRFYGFGEGAYVAGQVSANVTDTTMTGTARAEGETSNFTLQRSTGYNQAVTVATIVGDWEGSSGSLNGVYPGYLTIEANGSFTFEDGDCVVAGTLTPRGNVAVYNVTGQYQPTAQCPVNHTVSGVAGLDSSGEQLIVGVTLPDRSNGAMLLLERSPD